jgi:hypothetical protein
MSLKLLIEGLKFWGGTNATLGSSMAETCPTCGKGKLESREQKPNCIIDFYSCGHSRRNYSRVFVETIGVTDAVGGEHKLPSLKPLVFTKSHLFTAKISGLHNKDLSDYHQTTRFRLLNAEYSVKLILENYNNNVAFAVGLTGFLVQAKSALDSLSEEINLHYSLQISNPPWATSIERLMNNIAELSSKNLTLAQILSKEISHTKGSWFPDFKAFRDEEGVHRKRSPRNINVGTPAHDIEIGGKKVAEYCCDVLSRINSVIEECYDSMT